MHAALVERADRLEGIAACSPREAEHAVLTKVTENYETVRGAGG
jgi:hypothetical protein